MLARSMLAVALFACASIGTAQAEWTAQVFHRFVVEGTDSDLGYNPRLGVLRVGNVWYGVSTNGGAEGGGVVWRRNSSGMKVLYSFKDSDTANGSCGYSPSSTLIIDGAGRLYGTTFFGGTGDGGVVFRLVNDGTGEWTCKALKSFVRRGIGRRNGHSAFGGLLLHPADNRLYGTAQGGGPNNVGVIFRLSWNNNENDPDKDTYKVLYEFRKTGNGGYGPAGALAVDASGRMYGMTFFGGQSDGGTVYRITRGGNFTAIHQFNRNNGRKGYQPTQGPLLIDNATGTLYGATTLGGCPDGDTACGPTAITPAGVVFRMNTLGRGYRVLHTFDSSTPEEGYGPYGGLVMRSNGQIFGAAQFGGSRNGGVAFRLVDSADSNYTVLRNFDPDNDGYRPSGGLVLDQNNRLIGTNFWGGGDRGTLFRLKPP